MPDYPAPAPCRCHRAEERPETATDREARLQPRLHRLQRAPQAVRPARSAAGAGHGGEQSKAFSTLFTRARGNWRSTPCHRLSGPTTTPSRTPPITRKKPRHAQGCRRQGRHRDHLVGHARPASVQPQRQVDRLKCSRLTGRKSVSRSRSSATNGRVHQAHQEWRARRQPDWLDR